MKSSSTSVAAYMLAVFLSGVAVGGFGHRLYTAKSVSATAPFSPQHFRRQYVEEMRSRLQLNEAQVTDLEKILDETRSRYKAFRESHRAEMDLIQNAQVTQIRAILGEKQREEYERFRAERDKKKKEGK